MRKGLRDRAEGVDRRAIRIEDDELLLLNIVAVRVRRQLFRSGRLGGES